MITNRKKTKIGKFSYLVLIPIILLLTYSFSPGNSNEKNNTPSICPINKSDIDRKTSDYGQRTHPITGKKFFHNGIDFAAKEGTNILATTNGQIIKAEYDTIGYGKIILIKHDNTFSTFYAHLSEIKVKVGDIVKKGDIIGYVGNSGKSTGPHLHYEMWKNGDKVNPSEYFE